MIIINTIFLYNYYQHQKIKYKSELCMYIKNNIKKDEVVAFLSGNLRPFGILAYWKIYYALDGYTIALIKLDESYVKRHVDFIEEKINSYSIKELNDYGVWTVGWGGTAGDTSELLKDKYSLIEHKKFNDIIVAHFRKKIIKL